MSRILVKLEVDLTLMTIDANGDYSPSNVMTFQYFAAVPPEFGDNLRQNCSDLMVQIYNEHYRIFREREPNDHNFIAVVAVEPTIIAPAEYPEQPWLHGKCPSWEDSNLIGTHADGYNKLSSTFFEALLNSGV